MKQLIKRIGTIGLCLTLFSGCLKGNLPDLPAFTDANMTEMYSQYRYLDTARNADGTAIVRTVNLGVSNKTFDNGTASATVTVPDESNFTLADEWDKVAATNIVMMCNISTGATIEPVGDAPRLGTVGDYSKPQQYKVTAADGKTTKTWTINITLVK
ncbi:MAG: hypothetical protein QM802_18585 [Agriterribacter sp.]